MRVDARRMPNSTADNTPRWRRILTWFGISVALIVAYAWFFGVQTAIALEERYFGSKYPAVWQVPVELTDTSMSDSPGKKLSYLGCAFEVPWDDLDEQKTRLIGGWQTHSQTRLSISRTARGIARGDSWRFHWQSRTSG